jgi:hypothetical protein
MRTKIVAIVCLAMLAGACARSGSGGALRIVPLGGDVFVVHGSEESPVTEPQELSVGDSIRTGPGGMAFVEFPGDRAVELAPSTELAIPAADRSELAHGRALFHAPDGMTVASGPAQIEGTGEYFRVDRYVGALRLGVYSGSASIEGWDGRVPSLHQVGVSAGIVPEPPRPLDLDPRDRWDRRLLGDAMDLGDALTDIARGLASQLRPRAEAVPLESVLPQRFPARGAQSELRSVPVADGLVAAMVALQAARADDRSPLQVLRDVVRLRQLGAEWSIVVARWALLRSGVLAALSRITDVIASILVPSLGSVGSPSGSTASGGPGGVGGAAGGSGGGSSSSPPSSGGTGSEPPPSGGGDPDPPEEPPVNPPPPPPTCGSQIECAVEDVLDGAPGGLDVPGVG